MCCLNQEVELKLYEYSTFHLLKKGIEQRYPVEVIIGISDTTKDFSKNTDFEKTGYGVLRIFRSAEKSRDCILF